MVAPMGTVRVWSGTGTTSKPCVAPPLALPTVPEPTRIPPPPTPPMPPLALPVVAVPVDPPPVPCVVVPPVAPPLLPHAAMPALTASETPSSIPPRVKRTSMTERYAPAGGRGNVNWWPSAWTVIRRAGVARGQIERGADQREMAERLREVAEEALLLGVVLLREQADVVAQREQPLEERLRVALATHEGEAVGEPEAA